MAGKHVPVKPTGKPVKARVVGKMEMHKAPTDDVHGLNKEQQETVLRLLEEKERLQLKLKDYSSQGIAKKIGVGRNRMRAYFRLLKK